MKIMPRLARPHQPVVRGIWLTQFIPLDNRKFPCFLYISFSNFVPYQVEFSFYIPFNIIFCVFYFVIKFLV